MLKHRLGLAKQLSTGIGPKLQRIALIVSCLALIYALVVFALILSEIRSKPDSGINLVIVLGAQVKGAAPARPSQQLEERLDAALVYLEDNPEARVLVTGGQGSDEWEAEADVMARYLSEAGIDSERILVENHSVSTIENFSLGLELLDSDEIEDGEYEGKAIVVTNDYHMFRSLKTARANGFPHVQGLSAVSRSNSTLKSYLREILALGYHLIFTR